MTMTMSLQDYVELMDPKMNQPLSLDHVLQPFCLVWPAKAASDLLVGHVVEVLLEVFEPDQQIDPIDVASICFELGYDGAQGFLEEAPHIIFQSLLESNESPAGWSLPGGVMVRYRA